MFGHKAIDCIFGMRRWKSSTSNKSLDLLVSYIGHVECYMCHNFGNMAKDFLMPRSMIPSIQKKQPMKHAWQRNPSRALWNKKEEKLERCGIALFSHDEDEKWSIDSE